MKKLIIFLLILLFLSFGYFIYDKLSNFNVIVKFDDLEPFEKQMNVYFKGFKIGKTVKIYPNDDYTNTYLKLKLKSSKTKFPQNISARIRKKKTGGYVDIIFPDDPSLIKLKTNDEIKGNIAQDISTLLESENLEDIVVEAEGLVENANTAVSNLNSIFVELRKIIIDNRSNIDITIKNIAKTSSNLQEMTSKLNSALPEDKLKSSVDNISNSTENIYGVSKSLNGIAYQIDNTTMPILNNILCETNQTAVNVKDISCGIKSTLKQRMGILRLLFGTPVKDKSN